MSKLAKRNKDPSNQKGNIRTALAVTVALALGGAALVSRDSEPKVPNLTFESNEQAQARLQDLARVYGDEIKISANEKHDLNAAMEGAIPVFKDTIVEDLSNLSSLLPEGRGRKATVDERGKQATYTIYTSEYEGVKGITVTRGSTAGSTRTESLSLNFTKDGPEVHYSNDVYSPNIDQNPSMPGVQGSDHASYYLYISGDNSLQARWDDEATIRRYGRSNHSVSFDGHFGHGTGSLGVQRDFEFTTERIQDVGDMLTGAVAALSNPTQP